MSNCQLLNPCSHYRISPRGHTDDTQTWSCVSSSMSSPPIGLDLWSSEQSTRGQLVLARDPEVVLPLPMGPAALSIPSIGGMETLRGLSTLCWSVLSRRRRIPRSWLPRSRSSNITQRLVNHVSVSGLLRSCHRVELASITVGKRIGLTGLAKSSSDTTSNAVGKNSCCLSTVGCFEPTAGSSQSLSVEIICLGFMVIVNALVIRG